MVYMDNLRAAKATDTYICAGDPEGESWTPSFTYHGFRYVEIDGWEEVTSANINLLHFHSDVAQRASFNSSSSTLNTMQDMALGAQRSNMMTVPTDCDQRDERLGWMGDMNLSGDSVALNYDALQFIRFFVSTIATELAQDGSLTDVVPFARFGGRPGDVSWTAAFPNLCMPTPFTPHGHTHTNTHTHARARKHVQARTPPPFPTPTHIRKATSRGR